MLAYPDNTSPTGASSARAGDSRSIWIHEDPIRLRLKGSLVTPASSHTVYLEGLYTYSVK